MERRGKGEGKGARGVQVWVQADKKARLPPPLLPAAPHTPAGADGGGGGVHWATLFRDD